MRVRALAVLPSVAPERAREHDDEGRRRQRVETATRVDERAAHVAAPKRPQSMIVRAVVVETSGKVGPLCRCEVELDVVKRTRARCSPEAVALARGAAPPPEDAVRVAAKAREIVGQRDALDRGVDLEGRRIIKPIKATSTRGDPLR